MTNTHNQHNQHNQLKQLGFTLIEVLVALAILSVIAVTATKASMSYIDNIEGMRSRTLANFVAQNAAADLSINEQWLTGAENKQVKEQGRTWQIDYTPTLLENTSTPTVQAIDIDVVETFDESDKKGVGSSTTVYLSKPDTSSGNNNYVQ